MRPIYRGRQLARLTPPPHQGDAGTPENHAAHRNLKVMSLINGVHHHSAKDQECGADQLQENTCGFRWFQHVIHLLFVSREHIVPRR